MGKEEKDQGSKEIKIESKNEQKNKNVLSRRNFLGGAATAGVLGAGLFALPNFTKDTLAQEKIEKALADCFGCEIVPVSGEERAKRAFIIKRTAAKYEFDMPIPTHPCNEDEQLYSNRNYYGNFTKGIKRASGGSAAFFGLVDPVEYCKLLKALDTGIPANFEDILLGFSNNCDMTAVTDSESRLSPNGFEPNLQRRLETPQAGLNYDLEGKDYYQLVNNPNQIQSPPVAFPPAFKFSSKLEAVEIIEVYWQALTRDVPFIKYNTSSLVQKASDELDSLSPFYLGPKNSSGNVTPAQYSRGILKGDTKGPFLSQFFLRDIPYGVQTIPAKIKSPIASTANDYVTTENTWKEIQKGRTPNQMTAFDSTPRFIRSGRDLAEYVHSDAIYQAYLNAALLMLASPSDGGLGIPVNPNNPYRQDTGGYCKQNNFVEFGPSQLLSLLGEVSVRAHKAVWYQKWCVHRRLRPEEFGGRVHYNFNYNADFDVNELVFQSPAIELTESIYGSLFLPQAFPEGSPMHPAYGAGHATLAGAAVTILKAWFDSEIEFPDTLYVPESDGVTLLPYISSSVEPVITVADELNKLASNISLGRDIAGVHWRTDYTESVYLGERLAIQILEDWGFTYNEDFDGFKFRDFRGNIISVGEKKNI